MEPRRCFVTVGTTSFDKLIVVMNNEDTRQRLVDRFNITHLIIQYGRGKVKPVLETKSSLVITSFDFKPTLAEDMASADLVISHAGAGSIMEALRLRKPLIVVVNDDLMDNHQIELGRAMKRGQYCEYAENASQLLEALDRTVLDSFQVYPPRDTSKFAELVYEELGI